MNLSEIREHFEWLADDDTLDEDRLNILANQAYDRLNTMRKWFFLKTSDSSKTILANTTAYALPTDFSMPTALRRYSASDDAYKQLSEVPFDKRLDYHNVDGRYFIDKKNGTFVLTKTPDTSIVGNTLILDYIYLPAQMALDADEPVFDRAFHPLVPLEMARFYFYNDQGEKDRSWDGELRREYEVMLAQMRAWDARFSGVMEQTMLADAVSPFDNI